MVDAGWAVIDLTKLPWWIEDRRGTWMKLCDTILVKFYHDRPYIVLLSLSCFTSTFIPNFLHFPITLYLCFCYPGPKSYCLRMSPSLSLADGGICALKSTVVRKVFHFVNKLVSINPTVPLWCRYLEADSIRGSLSPTPCPQEWIFISQSQIR